MSARNPYEITTPAATNNNAFTPPSYWNIYTGNSNAPGNPIGDKNYTNTLFGRITSALWPGMASLIQSGQAYIPQLQQATAGAVTAANPWNLPAQVATTNRAIQQQAGPQANLASLIARNSGMSSGGVQGAQMGVANQAAQAQNTNISQMLSPQAMQAAWQKYQQTLQNAITPAGLQQFASLISGTPPTVSSGDGWSNIIGSLAGLAGNYFAPGVGGAVGSALGGAASSPGMGTYNAYKGYWG
jgi:hypothetical protein